MHALRDYQAQAIDAIKARWKDDDSLRRLAIVLPTGGGKTVVFAHLAAQILAAMPHGRVLVLVHTDELVRQAVQKINDHAPELIVGVVKAKENETTADVIVGSVQTLRNARRRNQIRDVVTVIVDECHHAAARTYMTILDHFGCFVPRERGKYNAKAIGFTATLVRGDDKSLATVWQDVAFSRDISWMVRKRYLIPPRGKAVEVPDLNLRDVKTTRKDFREGELGEALADSLAPEKIVEAYIEHAKGRKAILFAPTVASATVFAEAFTDLGIPTEVVHGKLPQDERDAILERHRAGITKIIANCMVLTEGYDDPEVDCIIVARPTKSKGLYIQMVGRGLRVDPARPYDDQDCLILDVVGANSMHDLRSVIDLSEKKLDPKKAGSGKSLIELEDEFDAGEGVEEDAPTFYSGDVEVRDFDPLGRSDPSKVWIKTSNGTHFVPAGTGAYVFIMEWPHPGKWSVAVCSKEPSDSVEVNGKRTSVGMTGHRGLSLNDAMVAAEDIAMDMGAASMNLANRRAPWRKAVASQKMLNLAKSLGVPASDADTAGKVSDRITRVMGSRRIDPLVRKVTGR